MCTLKCWLLCYEAFPEGLTGRLKFYTRLDGCQDQAKKGAVKSYIWVELSPHSPSHMCGFAKIPACTRTKSHIPPPGQCPNLEPLV